jgi:hypothetical protein
MKERKESKGKDSRVLFYVGWLEKEISDRGFICCCHRSVWKKKFLTFDPGEIKKEKEGSRRRVGRVKNYLLWYLKESPRSQSYV